MFKILNGDKHFFQWDLGQKLIVDSGFCAVHFCNDCESGKTYMTEVYEVGGVRVADVPNILLQSTNNIRVYGICTNEPSVLNTRTYEIFRVIPRAKPENYTYTEEEVLNYETLEKRVTALEEGAGGGGNSVTFEKVTYLPAANEEELNTDFYRYDYYVTTNSREEIKDTDTIIYQPSSSVAPNLRGWNMYPVDGTGAGINNCVGFIVFTTASVYGSSLGDVTIIRHS